MRVLSLGLGLWSGPDLEEEVAEEAEEDEEEEAIQHHEEGSGAVPPLDGLPSVTFRLSFSLHPFVAVRTIPVAARFGFASLPPLSPSYSISVAPRIRGNQVAENSVRLGKAMNQTGFGQRFGSGRVGLDYRDKWKRWS